MLISTHCIFSTKPCTPICFNPFSSTRIDSPQSKTYSFLLLFFSPRKKCIEILLFLFQIRKPHFPHLLEISHKVPAATSDSTICRACLTSLQDQKKQNCICSFLVHSFFVFLCISDCIIDRSSSVTFISDRLTLTTSQHCFTVLFSSLYYFRCTIRSFQFYISVPPSYSVPHMLLIHSRICFLLS